MKRLPLLSACCLLCLNMIMAHPSIGIVADSEGNVYYTDLDHVWKVTPDGNKAIYVRGVHTHELYMDEEDILFGEDSWYEGEETDKWGFAVWKRSGDGPLEFVVDSTEGFLFEHPFGFVHDENGNSYWTHKDDNSHHIQRRDKQGGEISTLATPAAENIRWDYWLNGQLYYIDMDDLYRIRDGTPQLVAADLRSDSPEFGPVVRDMHSIMGLWDDPDGNIYVAVFSGQVVKKISPDGKISDFIRTSGKWSPTGGLFDQNDNLWLLEYSTDNKARVRKFKPEDLTNPPSKMETQMDTTTWLLIGMIVLLVAGLLFLRSKNPRHRR